MFKIAIFYIDWLRERIMLLNVGWWKTDRSRINCQRWKDSIFLEIHKIQISTKTLSHVKLSVKNLEVL